MLLIECTDVADDASIELPKRLQNSAELRLGADSIDVDEEDDDAVVSDDDEDGVELEEEAGEQEADDDAEEDEDEDEEDDGSDEEDGENEEGCKVCSTREVNFVHCPGVLVHNAFTDCSSTLAN